MLPLLFVTLYILINFFPHIFDETNPFHVKNNYDDEPISLDNKASSSNQVDSSEKVKDQVDEPQDEEKALPPTENEELLKSWNVVHSHPK